MNEIFDKILPNLIHTAGFDTLFVQIYMEALPGVPGVSKNHNFFTNKTVEFLHYIELPPKSTNFKKSSKLKINFKKTLFS